MKAIIKNTAVLTAITLVAGIMLGLVYEITKEPIAVAKEKAKQKAYQTVMQDADSFENYQAFDEKQAAKVLRDKELIGCQINEVVIAQDKGTITGYVITVISSEGYGGDIQVSVGVSIDGTLQGIEILSMNETVGLGMNANTPDYKKQYAGKNVEAFVVTKTEAVADNEIDAISGATVTSNAVTNAVNAGILYFKQVLGGGANE